MTHSGLMSTQEAVHYGVPMIGVPIFGDQFLNIRLSVNKKIAVATDYKTLTTESFTNDLNTVLKNPSYRYAFINLWFVHVTIMSLNNY